MTVPAATACRLCGAAAAATRCSAARRAPQAPSAPPPAPRPSPVRRLALALVPICGCPIWDLLSVSAPVWRPVQGPIARPPG
eukprot:3320306-Prymnesium_polylepis.1